MTQMQQKVTVIGGGLAGCEAAWQLLKRDIQVTMYEQRPVKMTPAHTGCGLAELVCSNSLRSDLLTSAVGMLKAEMRELDSLIIKAAEHARVPAGKALAVDRESFHKYIEEALIAQAGFELIREEVTEIPAGPVVIASGPLTSGKLAEAIQELVGSEYLYFYDAIAPIVDADSINMDVAFRASRYDEENDGDYLNCPMNKEEYLHFLDELLKAEQYASHDFEKEMHFEGCLPLEEMASRGEDVLRFGPLKPVGLPDPRTGEIPYAVLQLRQDDLASDHFNLVGCQTKMKQGEQRRVFRLIPGLENAEFSRLGQMHRNSFINSPLSVNADFELRNRELCYVAGQISGVEGYVESAASGMMAGIYLARKILGQKTEFLTAETASGALGNYIANANPEGFQPMNITFGLLERTGKKVRGPRRVRREKASLKGIQLLKEWKEKEGI